MSDELKRCPCCGGTGETFTETQSAERGIGFSHQKWVACRKCDYAVPYSIWNARPIAAPDDRYGDGFRDGIKKAADFVRYCGLQRPELLEVGNIRDYLPLHIEAITPDRPVAMPDVTLSTAASDEKLADELATQKALAALDELAESWAEEVELARMVAAIADQDDRETRIIALAKQSLIEGAYLGRTSHDAALRQPSAPAWRPISEAPKDGTLVDLWCVAPDDSDIEPEDGGIRLTCCSWHEADEIFPHTGWVRITDDGNLDLIDSPPTSPLGLPRWIPTHFMFRPAPPTDGENGK